ncbi:hypothetical protein FF38_13677 [Lucilia cuprina]|uniref:Uncharacterized protein n=1 Tax=Lucilia cuprina TaxID=7375 RepID=A0A0L0CNW2_LUCCU|nr:hypothetical protein FF38_13677 [Lucilia cuprina]
MIFSITSGISSSYNSAELIGGLNTTSLCLTDTCHSSPFNSGHFAFIRLKEIRIGDYRILPQESLCRWYLLFWQQHCIYNDLTVFQSICTFMSFHHVHPEGTYPIPRTEQNKCSEMILDPQVQPDFVVAVYNHDCVELSLTRCFLTMELML